jgi:hypothetical protein
MASDLYFAHETTLIAPSGLCGRAMVGGVVTTCVMMLGRPATTLIPPASAGEAAATATATATAAMEGAPAKVVDVPRRD